MLHVRRDNIYDSLGSIYQVQDLGRQVTYGGVKNIFTADEYEITFVIEKVSVSFIMFILVWNLIRCLI